MQEPANLKNVSTFRYNGLVHKKTVAVTPADKKGFTVTLKTKKNQVSFECDQKMSACKLISR